MIKIEQLEYPDIAIDNSEKDIIQIWQNGKEDSNVIQIEREKFIFIIGQLIVIYSLQKQK